MDYYEKMALLTNLRRTRDALSDQEEYQLEVFFKNMNDFNNTVQYRDLYTDRIFTKFFPKAIGF